MHWISSRIGWSQGDFSLVFVINNTMDFIGTDLQRLVRNIYVANPSSDSDPLVKATSSSLLWMFKYSIAPDDLGTKTWSTHNPRFYKSWIAKNTLTTLTDLPGPSIAPINWFTQCLCCKITAGRQFDFSDRIANWVRSVLEDPYDEINIDHAKSPYCSASEDLYWTLEDPAQSNPALGGEPESGKRGEKRGHQDTHKEISSESHHSVNTDDTCDTGDEGPRPAKWRKSRSAPAVTAPLHLK